MRKAKELIKAATIATALDKVTGKILGWAVKSNSSNKYYQVTTMIIAGIREFFCTCEAKDWGCSECRHIQAVKEVLVAKAEIAQEEAEAALQKLVEFEAIKAQVEAIEAGWSKEEAKAAVAEAEKLVTKPVVEQAAYIAELKEWRKEYLNEKFEAKVANGHATKSAPIVSAPTFTNRENYALTSNAGFSLLKVS